MTRIRRLLHTLWSKAVGTLFYRKQEWKDLANEVDRLEQAADRRTPTPEDIDKPVINDPNDGPVR